jgi:outer membrane protein assembly factor BamB
MKKLVILFVVLCEALLGGLLQADSSREPASSASFDWPQWRGVNRDAVSSETGLVDRWPDAGPRVVWRAEVGAGFSSVSISGGKLYTLWDEKGTQYLFCLDALTGEERWRRAVGAAFTNHWGNGPRSTPLVDGDLVFAVGTQGRLVAASKDTGELRWQHDLVAEFAAKLPSYGYSSSPLVALDRLVLEAGAKDATFMAFDKQSGEVAWRSESDRPAYSSPIRASIAGVDQIVFWSAHGLHSVSPETGKVLWRYSWETFCAVSGDPLNTGTPIFIEPDRIYISSGSGAAVIRISREGEKFKVDAVWESEKMRSDVNASVRLGRYIYGFDRGTLQCLDAGTGEVRWKARGFQRGSLIAADGKLIVLGEGGQLALVEASPDGFVQMDRAQILDGKNWTSPSLAGGKLYLRNHEELVCLDLKGRGDPPAPSAKEG